MEHQKPPSTWKNLATRFREIPEEEPPNAAPLGFATRVVARAELTPAPNPLARLRNWSLALAGVSVCTLLISAASQPPTTQFLPLPEPEFPTPIAR